MAAACLLPLVVGCAAAEDAAEATRPEPVAEAPSAGPVPARLVRLVSGAAGAPRAACLEATRAAERRHGIPDGLMVAIALAESGLHAYAMNVGGRPHFPPSAEEARRIYLAAGNASYLMAGCVQVNARVHARGDAWPLDPRRSADWGAEYLRTHYDRIGNWPDAIRRWNGATNNALVCRVQAKLQVVNPGNDVLRDVPCRVSAAARERRNGQQLLEIAEAGDR
ncbi:transglycosylase SLT domain-containing protein [Roseomonas sp. CCTCC AB2023176]|uniref:transglycosylase SLT domain-containing protein n=1 Tax=Roseomonas sp. CCTCC AB2023176 TaxID=3342640 RepID=UPI0035D64F9D